MKTIKNEIVYDKNMVTMNITDVIENNYMPYAMSVILSRAIPDVRDGLKPSHRKLLYTMYIHGLLKGPRMKSATIAGATMKYNPHGESNYDTMVRLSKDNETLLLPLVDNKGDMGKHHSKTMRSASSRYTEARLMPVVKEFFDDLGKNGVDLIDNYDGTAKEPVLLPVKFPHILCNPNLGIAVGMASNLCSFNLNEICAYTIAYIKDKKADILSYIKGPDFQTGGYYLYDKKSLSSILNTGVGTLVLRSKYEVDEKHHIILIKEIPFSTNSEAIIDDIYKLCINNKIEGIKDIRDETDIEGLKIAIEYKKDVNVETLMANLYKKTHVEDTFACNFNVLTHGTPKVIGVNQILDDWLEFRIETIRRITLFDKDKLEKKLHLLQGLNTIIMNIDKVIKIIRNTEKEQDVVPNLIKKFKVDEIQANYIAEIKLRNINKEFILNKIKEIDSIVKEIKRLEGIFKSDVKIKNIICKELQQISKDYGQPRKTEIIEVTMEQTPVDQIEDYEIRAILTEHGYLKKIKLPIKKEDDNNRIKEDDKVIFDKTFTNTTEVLVFTNKAVVYKLRLYEMDLHSLNDLGVYLPSLLELEVGENILKVCFTNDYGGNMVFIFENGKVAKVPLSAYETKTKRKKLLKAFCEMSNIINIYCLEDEAIISIGTNDDRHLAFDSSLIPLKTTKSTQGIQAVRLSKNCKVMSSTLMKNNNKKTLATKLPMAPKK